MDPIKVDFSKKGGPKEIVIPPDKAALKIILSVLCSIVTAGIAFYIMLPPLNFKAYEFYGFLAIIVASYALFSAIFTSVFSKPEYLPYFKRQMIVPAVIGGVIALICFFRDTRGSLRTGKLLKNLAAAVLTGMAMWACESLLYRPGLSKLLTLLEFCALGLVGIGLYAGICWLLREREALQMIVQKFRKRA